MPWFKVDDQLATHPKILGVPLAAIGLWVMAGAWASQHLTDGYVPRTALPKLGAQPAQAAAFVKAGLWEEELDGWRFHDWLHYQPAAVVTKALREDRSAARSAAGTLGNHNRWHAERGVRAADCPLCQEGEP